MPRITEEEAIAECKKLWAAIEKSGLSKSAFLDTEEGKAYRDKGYWAECPLCEYATSSCLAAGGLYSCTPCPLLTKYGKRCKDLGYDVPTSKATEEFFAAVKGL